MKFYQTIFGQAIFGALIFMAVITLLEFPMGDRDLQTGLARAVFGGIVGFCSARAFSLEVQVQMARFSRQAACYVGYLTLSVVAINALSGNKDVLTTNGAVDLVVFALVFGGVMFFLIRGRSDLDRNTLSLSYQDVAFPWGLVALLIVMILITGSRELGAITLAAGSLFSPVWPYENDAQGADKWHRIWGLGLCCLGVIYYFTLYPQLIEQVAWT